MSSSSKPKASSPDQNTPEEPLSFEKVWLMFQETDKKFQDTDRKFKCNG